MNRQADLALMDSVWNRIRDYLENERHRIYEEIKNYPTPIPACDAQFNYHSRSARILSRNLIA